ncbi:MAG: EamA family transporter [Deltaproteobacteria bacterium]
MAWKALLGAVICSVLVVIGQIMWKVSLNNMGGSPGDILKFSVFKQLFFSPVFIGGTILFVVSTCIWIALLSTYRLSYVYPLLSMTYVLTILFSWLFLGESVPITRWAGAVVICLGIFLVYFEK